MISWQETRNRLREDKKRLLLDSETNCPTNPIFLFFHPSYQCVVLHRVSHYFFANKRRMLARLFWHLNLVLTGADINPISDMDGGLVIRTPEKIIIIGKTGKNCTFKGQGGLGGGRTTKDIGAGPGLPIVGDEVSIDFGGVVLGPVFIGDNARIGAKAFIIRDIPDGSGAKISQAYKHTIEKSNPLPAPLKESKSESFWSLINQDILQYLGYSSDFQGNDVSLLRKISAFVTPCLLCNFLYRISHWLFRRNWKRLANFFCMINCILHRAHISPGSEIGGGLYIPHTSGIIFNGRAGKNLVLYANATVSFEQAHVDNSRVYGDSPTLGDNVIVGTYSVVTGGITVNNNTSIGANVFLDGSVEENTIILSRERVKMEAVEKVS